MTPEDRKRIEQVERWLMLHVSANSDPYADLSRAFGELRFLLSIVKGQEAAPSDVDKLLFRLASLTCSHLEIGMRDCTDELPFADWCVVCQARGLLQKYARGITREEEIATSMRSLCVEKVKAKRAEWLELANSQPGWNQHVRAADSIIEELEPE